MKPVEEIHNVRSDRAIRTTENYTEWNHDRYMKMTGKSATIKKPYNQNALDKKIAWFVYERDNERCNLEYDRRLGEIDRREKKRGLV